MYGEEAKFLLHDLKQNTFLPQYQEERLRKIIQEINILYESISNSLSNPSLDMSNANLACGIIVHYHSLLRNKQCALAYLLKIIEKIWWETGSVISPTVQPLLSPHEKNFFRQYDLIMADYMGHYEDLDLTSDPTPPKDLFIEVLVLESYGEIQTLMGPVNLEKDTTHFLRRTDVELLIRKGLKLNYDLKEFK